MQSEPLEPRLLCVCGGVFPKPVLWSQSDMFKVDDSKLMALMRAKVFTPSPTERFHPKPSPHGFVPGWVSWLWFAPRNAVAIREVSRPHAHRKRAQFYPATENSHYYWLFLLFLKFPVSWHMPCKWDSHYECD
jgi:hypothetical protein